MSSRASKHRQKRRQRVGVWLQRQVATLAGRIILLLAGIVIVTVAGNTVMYFSLDAFSSYDDALWWTMDHLFDPGALNEDRGWAQRLVGLALVAAGLIILVGILVTLATEVVERSLERLASADLPVDVRQHLLFVGWDDTTPDILQTLDYLQPHLLGGEPTPFRSIVVLAPDSLRDRRAQLQNLLHQAIPSTTTQITFGNVLQPESYERAAARDAYAIVISGAGTIDPSLGAADANAVQAAATLAGYLNQGDGTPPDTTPLVSVVLYAGEHADAAKTILPPHFNDVVVDRIITGMLALELTAPAWGKAVRNLLVSGEGAGLHLVRDDRLTGIPFRDLIGHLAAAVPLGVMTTRDGSPQSLLAPDPSTVLGPDDAVIVFAADTAAADALREVPTTDTPAWAGEIPSMTDLEVRTVLVVGFNSRIVALLRELALAPAARFHVTSLSQTPDSRRSRSVPGWVRDRLTIRYLDGDPTDGSTLRQAIRDAKPDAIIVSGDVVEHPRAPDAAAVFSYLATQQVVQGAVPVLAVAYSSTYADLLAQDAGGANLPGAAEMVGGTLAWTLLRTDITPVLAALLDPYRTTLRTVRLPDTGTPARFDALYRRALQHGAVLAGIMQPDGTPSLAPPPNTPVEPGTALLFLTSAARTRPTPPAKTDTSGVATHDQAP
ncbi:hypothetical protein [Sphaerobacter thermophilus]|uniref:TrkA-N domain protein n=1 Tax=Sphaerobacter thermophilus (strain ATCC 49802 / DSM 20745 / KCCM 41009 / NCIMB 13125 / S 6022) TaxID=479434 RepID=D1CAS2_SPHTD|nr:hypothetical protein [Sphaerobacter thermophilus]ACZ40915.1 hypothetical protein Sthe_3516 [Sphaerobacter thermophilus DSM 20745]